MPRYSPARATLFIRTRSGGWSMTPGLAADLVCKIESVRAPAFVRTDDGKVIAYTDECDGGCDNPRHRWHYFAERDEPYEGMTGCPWEDEE